MFHGDGAGVVFHHSQSKEQSDTGQQPPLTIHSPFCPRLPILLLLLWSVGSPGFQRSPSKRETRMGSYQGKTGLVGFMLFNSPFAAWGFPGGGNLLFSASFCRQRQ